MIRKKKRIPYCKWDYITTLATSYVCEVCKAERAVDKFKGKWVCRKCMNPEVRQRVEEYANRPSSMGLIEVEGISGSVALTRRGHVKRKKTAKNPARER